MKKTIITYAFVVCFLITALSGCSGNDGVSIIENNSLSESKMSEESSSYYMDSELSENLHLEESSKNIPEEYCDESSSSEQGTRKLLSEQDAIDFYKNIVLLCTDENLFPILKRKEEIERNKFIPLGYAKLVGAYRKASLNDSSILIDENTSKKLDEDNISYLVQEEILSEADILWIESHVVGTGYLYRKTDVQNAIYYFYGINTINIANWILKNDDGTDRVYETTNGEYYINWVGGSGSYNRYYYSLCDYHIEGEIGSIDVHCIKTTSAGALWVQDVAAEKDFEDLDYGFFQAKNIDVLDNDQTYSGLIEEENIDENSLGIIRINFFKDDLGVHVYDIHYPSKNVFRYIGDERLIIYNSPSYDDPTDGEGYSPLSYITIFRIRDGWGEIRYRNNIHWVRMDDMIPLEDTIIEYPDPSGGTDVSSESIVEDFQENSTVNNTEEPDTQHQIDFESYQDIINNYILHMDGSTTEEYAEYDEHIGYTWGGCSLLIKIGSCEELGYHLIDLDGNGIEELLIGSNTAPSLIFDLYTMGDDGIPIQLRTSWERSSTYLLDDNSVFIKGSNGAGYTIQTVYQLQGVNFVLSDSIYSQVEEDGSIGWYHGIDASDFDKQSQVSKEEAEAYMNEWDSKRVDLQYETFYPVQ